MGKNKKKSDYNVKILFKWNWRTWKISQRSERTHTQTQTDTLGCRSIGRCSIRDMPEDHVRVSHELGASFTLGEKGSLERELNNRSQRWEETSQDRERVNPKISYIHTSIPWKLSATDLSIISTYAIPNIVPKWSIKAIQKRESCNIQLQGGYLRAECSLICL